ncbi:hypothetical protein C817_04593 [Dorea sp. 5-2]|jgi:predicted phage tail component-like protein|nr:hypothetical protein C817_04593 [Dorea sp. 5-2]MCI9025218.1 phage tail protein [Dorea sp.]
MWVYDMEYAGFSASEHNIYIVKRPSIPSPERNYLEIEIPGRDGKLYVDEGTVKDIEISVEMNFMGRHDEWFGYWRKAKGWLMQKGQHRLIFGDDADYFYLAKKVVIPEAERVCYEIGKFTVVFTCYGYQYLKEGGLSYSCEEVSYNAYEIAHPVYVIKGEGVCTLTVNGKDLVMNVGQNITVDTELQIAYRTDGKLMNTSVKGKYEDLYLQPGENVIGVTEGFEVEVIPRWRCL